MFFNCQKLHQRIQMVLVTCCFLILYLLTIVVKGYDGDDVYTLKDFCVRLTTNHTALISWSEPVQFRSEIQSYTLYYTKNAENPLYDWNSVTTGNYPMITIRNISLGQIYYFKIRLHIWGLDTSGPLSDINHFQMLNRTRSCYDQPKTLTIKSLNVLRATATSKSSVEVWWNVEYDPYQVKGFMVFYGTSDLSPWFNKTAGLVHSIELTNLNESVKYIIAIAAITESGLQYYPQQVTVSVYPEEVPMQVKIRDVTADSMILEWLPPILLRPVKYKITYDAFKDFIDSDGIRQQYALEKIEILVDERLTSFELVDLMPYTNYFINISAVPVDYSYRPSIQVSAKTEVGPPGAMHQPTVNGLIHGENIQVLLPKASEENGPISYYYVIVIPENDESNDLRSAAYATEDLVDNKWYDGEEIDAPYIAAKFSSKIPYAFILGVGVHGGYQNYKLASDKKYRVFIRAVVVTSQGHLYADSSYSEYFSVKDEKEKFALQH